jgi:nitroreductase
LAPLWAKVFGLYRDTFAHLPSSTMQPDQSERLNRAVEYQAEHFAQTPTLIVACYDTSFQRKSLLAAWRTILGAVVALGWRNALGFLRHAKRFADMNEAASVYPGVQNLLLTARALGLGATITTMHLALEDQFKQALGIPRHVKTFALVPVGWPRGKFGPVRRRPIEEAIHRDRW